MDMDFLLIQKMRMGDETAIDQFVDKYYSKINKYCRMHISDAYLAEDMTQETFVRFFGSFEKYQHYGKAVNYLYVIAANVCKDYYKKKQELPLAEMDEAQLVDDKKPDLRMDIVRAFEKLPTEIKEVAILYFIQEQKQKNIAKILGIGLPLVKYRIRRARELLGIYLGEEER